MKADSFAKLVVLDSLVEAEIGYFIEHSPPSVELFREGMVSRISDLVDEIDVLDAVAAGRVYDAIVDFLAEFPEDHDGIVEAAVRFRRAIDRIVARGLDRRDLGTSSTWAVVLDELLAELADEYHVALADGPEPRPREFMRVESLLGRSRSAVDRMLWEEREEDAELWSDFDRLVFEIRHRRLNPVNVDYTVRSLQRRALRYRPSTLTRVGAFVLGTVLRRDRRSGARGRDAAPEGGTNEAAS